MIIDFTKEIKDITPAVKLTDDYLSCEKVLISNIKKHFVNGVDIPVIQNYIKKLLIYFEELIATNQHNTDSIRYRYAAGFLKMLTAPIAIVGLKELINN